MRWKPPTSGFVTIVACSALVVGFFGWGLTTPRLQEIWEIRAQLRAGSRARLSARELRLFRGTLWDYPAYASHLVKDANMDMINAHSDGVLFKPYAYIVRKLNRPGDRLEIGLNNRKGSVSVVLSSATTSVTQTLEAGAPITWQPPETEPFPQIIEIHVEGGAGKRLARQASLFVRLIESS